MASTDLEKVNVGQLPPELLEPVKYRSLLVQVLLTIVTCGFYILYWFYSTAQDFEKVVKREEPIVLWTILLFVPFLSLYSDYKYSELFEEVAPEYSKWLLLALWLFFPPGVWLIVQLKLNRLAQAQEQTPPVAAHS